MVGEYGEEEQEAQIDFVQITKPSPVIPIPACDWLPTGIMDRKRLGFCQYIELRQLLWRVRREIKQQQLLVRVARDAKEIYLRIMK